MNRIKVNGMLRRGEGTCAHGDFYLLDVRRKSKTVDTLLVACPDSEALDEGAVCASGRAVAEYIHGMGVPVVIIPDSVEPAEDDGSSRMEATGRLKAAPEPKKTRGGKILASVLLETKEGQVPVLLWGQTAEKAAKTMKAGDMVTAVGRLQSREYTSRKDGSKHTTYELSAKDIKPVKADKEQADG